MVGPEPGWVSFDLKQQYKAKSFVFAPMVLSRIERRGRDWFTGPPSSWGDGLLVGEVLDRVDQHSDFDPRKYYQLTIADGELTRVERAARVVATVDDIELDL